jgi:hypothetical protein
MTLMVIPTLAASDKLAISAGPANRSSDHCPGEETVALRRLRFKEFFS